MTAPGQDTTSQARASLLLTGATGFLGQRLLRALHARGMNLVLLKRPQSDTSMLSDLRDRVDVYDMDRTPMHEVFDRSRIDVVVHTATCYGRARESLSEVAEVNVRFPVRLMESAIDAGVRLFLNADTFSAQAEALPAGLEAYVLTKRHFRECGELLASARGIRFLSLRIEQMYGPGDNAQKFVPSLLRALRANVPSFDLTTGDQRRDFIYVDDVVAAFVALIERADVVPAAVRSVQVGTGESHSIREFAELARDLTGSRTELRFGALPYRHGELMASRADTASLRALGWVPRVSLREGLRRILAEK